METIQFALPVKYMPKEASGFKLGLGCWIENGTDNNQSQHDRFLSLYRSLPSICRLIVATKPADPDKAVYNQFRQKMDIAFGEPCR